MVAMNTQFPFSPYIRIEICSNNAETPTITNIKHQQEMYIHALAIMHTEQ